MRDPTFVAFATMKGGAGKSTLTTLVASYLYYNEGLEVVAIDCDDSQFSLEKYRKHDLQVSKVNPFHHRRLVKFYKTFRKDKAYKIMCTPVANAVSLIKDYLENGENPDVVFFDITGTINNPDIPNLLAVMDYIFVPTSVETGEAASSIAFANHVKNKMMTTGKTNVKELSLIWTKAYTRQKNRVMEAMDDYLAKLGLHSLETIIPNSSKYTKDGLPAGNERIFRSTLLPPDNTLLKGSNLPELVKEIREIIKV